MKIAVTFFGKNKKINNKVKNNTNQILNSNRKYAQKYYNLNDILSYRNVQKYNIKVYEIVICFIIGILLVYNNISLISISSNIFKIEKVNISKDSIMALNGLANIDNYMFSKIIEKATTEEDGILPEEKAMDDVVTEYNEQAVFNNMKEVNVDVVVQTDAYQKLNVCGVDITNYSTKRDIDFEKILNDNTIELSKSLDDILLYTTHTSESYANSDKYKFEYTSPRRSTDGNYNMLAISKKLASNLNSKGINTICSLTPHDYGEYNSAYSNSRFTFENLINEQNNIHVAIDVHRDAIEDLDFAPVSSIKGYEVASLMLVMGIGYDDGFNPYYEQNLKLALELQILANKIYPGLFRPMIIRNSIYNQDIIPNSFLVEVGASGNTIEQAELATRCLSNLINILYKD